jgi:6-phosphofructokinase 1
VDFTIDRLGPSNIPSPLVEREFTPDDAKVLYHSSLDELLEATKDGSPPPALEMAGPRESIFFDPSKLKCGIVTCGGICPGENDVIRALVLECCRGYGTPAVLGFRYGYQGLVPSYGHDVLELTPESVEEIHNYGGTVLASSRGHQEIGRMVDTLDRMNVRVLFTLGGDGTQRAASLMAEEIAERGLKIAIVGLPKTIDNDLELITQTFGFITAVSEARNVLATAYTEARGAPNGIGLVRLMGRMSGWIAAYATLANSEVDFCLVPEVPFRLEGDDGLFASVRRRLESRGHCVIVAAEGAGQDITPGEPDRDASGNLKLKDIGLYLRDALTDYFQAEGIPVNLKYIDPSYIIRSARANPADAVFCQQLAQNAVHAAMTGRTNMLVGFWNRHFTHVPLKLVIKDRKRIDPKEALWQAVLSSTGQPATMGYEP